MEVLIPFGKSKNGSLVFIDEVTSGLACDCVCISCGMALSAFFFQNGIRRDHFKHAPKVNSKDKPCDISPKRAIFWLCREIILDNTEIELPNYAVDHAFEESSEVIPIVEAKTHNYQSNITLNPSNESELSELAILHTNECDITLVVTFHDETSQYRVNTGQKSAVIEIDISDFKEYIEGLKNSYRLNVEQRLLNDLSIKKWLYHPAKIERITHYYRSKNQKKKLAEKAEYLKTLNEQEYTTEYNPISGMNFSNYRHDTKKSNAYITELNASPKRYEKRWFRCPFCQNIWAQSTEHVSYSVEKIECTACTRMVHISN